MPMLHGMEENNIGTFHQSREKTPYCDSYHLCSHQLPKTERLFFICERNSGIVKVEVDVNILLKNILNVID